MTNTIKDIIEICNKKNLGEIGEDDFQEFLKSLTIVKRLSMYKKGMIISMALADMDEMELITGFEADASTETEYIYIRRFILSYIETDEEFYQINDDDVEDLYCSGLVDYILDNCGRDFEIIKRMFDNSIKFKYLNMINSMIGNVTFEKNDENIDKISTIFEDRKMVETVAEIMQFNDPALKKVKDEIFKPLEK